jgi:FkbM family methyltransferase
MDSREKMEMNPGAHSTESDNSSADAVVGAQGGYSGLRRRNKMSMRDAAKSLALNLGYDIRRTGSHFYKRPIDFLRSRNIDLVIDVGANVGQYGKSLRKDAYAGWIVSFEPIAAAYEELAALASKDPRWKAMNMALGDNEGLAKINISQAAVFSSILPQLPAATAFDAEAQVVRSESVRVARLDDIFAELPKSKATFLKIDTQGYERQVLLGAQERVSSFLGVQMELPIVHLYDGTWKFHEAVAYMSDLGFEISNIVPVSYDPADTVSLIEVDCIFLQKVAADRSGA